MRCQSTHRTDRSGPISVAFWHWYMAMYLIMKPSAGVSKTMSASFRPLCGRAPSGSFPTFTASAGRSGTPPGARSSVSGQNPGATVSAGVVVVVVAGVVVAVVDGGDATAAFGAVELMET